MLIKELYFYIKFILFGRKMGIKVSDFIIFEVS